MNIPDRIIPEYCWNPPPHRPHVWLDRMGKDLAQDVNGPPQGQAGQDPPTNNEKPVMFDWILKHAVSHICALDTAVKQGNDGAYLEARNNYLDFVHRLDCVPMQQPDVKIKWVYIMPTIREGTIQGVTVVVEWNPSSSSSTIRK